MPASTAAGINVEELHGLKRKQLQALCKKHGIKANGKNEELIEHLTEYAQSGNGSNDAGDADSSSDTDSNGEQEYESAAETEDKSNEDPAISEPADEELGSNAASGDSNNTSESTESSREDAAELDSEPVETEAERADEHGAREKKDKGDIVFKTVPASSSELLSMQVPESIRPVDNTHFSSLADKITAEMEARASALAADQRKEAVEKYNSTHSILPAETPSKSKQPKKAISFDKAHERLFEHDDSITSHWAAKKVPGAATPRSKRANGDLDSDLQASSKRQRIEPLLTPQSARQRRKSTKNKSMTAKAQRTSAMKIKAPDGSRTAFAGGRTRFVDALGLSSTKLFADKPLSSTSGSKKAEFAPLAKPATKAPATGDLSETRSTPTPATSKPTALPAKKQEAKPTTKPDAKQAVKKPAQEKAGKPAEAPSLIPRPRPIAKPRPHKAAAAPSDKPNPKNASKLADARSKTDKKHPSTKLPAHKAASYQNVESKLKSYIHAKPPPPKVKAVESSVPAAKDPKKQSAPLPQAENNRGKKGAKRLQPEAATSSEKKDAADRVPRYMKSTKATKIRSHQTTAKPAPIKGQQPTKSSTSSSDARKARYNPYNRPAKPKAAAKATAK
ncbi:hypothetical protein GQ54DRAFT_67399 [Martensiomyces pterosporus]|nr:hypothetical protein GQ54DRAFT_67399 [Martensiomyces pterosporus]